VVHRCQFAYARDVLQISNLCINTVGYRRSTHAVDFVLGSMRSLNDLEGVMWDQCKGRGGSTTHDRQVARAQHGRLCLGSRSLDCERMCSSRERR